MLIDCFFDEEQASGYQFEFFRSVTTPQNVDGLYSTNTLSKIKAIAGSGQTDFVLELSDISSYFSTVTPLTPRDTVNHVDKVSLSVS